MFLIPNLLGGDVLPKFLTILALLSISDLLTSHNSHLVTKSAFLSTKILSETLGVHHELGKSHGEYRDAIQNSPGLPIKISSSNISSFRKILLFSIFTSCGNTIGPNL